MKTVVGALAACIGVFAAFLLQQTLPAIHMLHGARFVIVPMLFCYAAMALPFPAMLLAAFCTGLLSDLMYLSVVEGRVEIALGFSVFFFVIYGCIANGYRPSYLSGHWWPVIPLSVICTWAFLLMQFAMIMRTREGFVFDQAILWRLFAPGLLAGLFAPLLHVVVKPFVASIPDKPLAHRLHPSAHPARPSRKNPSDAAHVANHLPRSLPLVSPLRAALRAGIPACSHRPVVAARAVGFPHQITADMPGSVADPGDQSVAQPEPPPWDLSGLPAHTRSNSCQAHADDPSMEKPDETALHPDPSKDEKTLTSGPGLIQVASSTMNTNDPTSFAAEPSSPKNIMGNDVEMTGTLRFGNELIFDGKLDGGILSEKGVLTLEKNSQVKGEVKAKAITVNGTVNGNISASERCELKASSQLIGDVMAPIIIVDAGATFIGKSKVTSTKTPAVEPAHSKTAKIISRILSYPVFSRKRDSGVRAAAFSSLSRPT